MSETMVLTGRLNGTGAPEGKSRTGKPRGKGERKPRGGSRKGMRSAKRLAAVCGSVATGVLALSVVHCTQAISSLTGSHWLLSALLAIGIDAGMVASEVAEVASHGTSAAEPHGSAGHAATPSRLSSCRCCSTAMRSGNTPPER